MNNFILNFMGKYGYFAIFILIILEAIFPPIPSEIILLFAGFMTTYTNMNIFASIIISTFSSLVSALLLYYFGFLLSKIKIRKIIFINKDDIEKVSDWFNKKGHKAVFIGRFFRFFPLFRSLISIPAGMNNMSIVKFSLYTSLGNLLWNSILIILGNVLGDNWQSIATFLSKYSLYSIVISVMSFLICVGYKCWNKRKSKVNIATK